MSKKPSKSIQAIIITLVAGMIIPKVFDISGNALLDKFLWKGILSASFSIAGIIVGMLYAGKFIRGRVAGGKSRISIYFILTAIFANIASVVCAFIREISPTIKIVLASVAILAITLLIAKLVGFCFKVKKDFKSTQERSVERRGLSTISMRSPDPTSEHKDFEIAEQTVGVAPTIVLKTEVDTLKTSETPSHSNAVTYKGKQGKTLFELWQERDISEKCLTATNDENPDLKWVKIYKPPYPNGKFYGYVMMCNAHNTVNGEIYFADRSIWRVC